MEIQIRPAVDGDLPNLVEMYEAFLDETLASAPGSKRNPELDAGAAVANLMIRPHSVTLVAEWAGAPVGFAQVELRRATGRPEGWWARLRDAISRRRMFLPALTNARGWIAHLYVVPQRRRGGVASALVRAAAEWSKSRGASSLDLNVLAANAAARGLYEKLGMSATLVEYRMDL